jgi:hypothetical protein
VPSSSLDLTGLASYEIFLRGTLDKIGAYPDMVHIGDYKTATNQLTEKTMTPAHREMAESLNADAFEQLIRAIADGRKKAESDVRALVDQGRFFRRREGSEPRRCRRIRGRGSRLQEGGRTRCCVDPPTTRIALRRRPERDRGSR